MDFQGMEAILIPLVGPTTSLPPATPVGQLVSWRKSRPGGLVASGFLLSRNMIEGNWIKNIPPAGTQHLGLLAFWM